MTGCTGCTGWLSSNLSVCLCSDMKPQDIYYLTQNFNQPVLIRNSIKWKLLSWSLEDWKDRLGDEKLAFRKIPFSKTKFPIWERNCENVTLTMEEFLLLQDLTSNSLYFDYKYMKDWFVKFPDVVQEVNWGELGYPDVTGEHSTIWLGSCGAHTPCHADTYGCNLVAQIHGRKEWILFPPEVNLQPSRVPYEESSVYSKLNFFSPDVERFKGVCGARHVILEPGDVLFVPHQWWHYVENLETSISVNTWIPLKQDDRRRLEEALVQSLVHGIVCNSTELNENMKEYLLNPNSNHLTKMSSLGPAHDLSNALQVYASKSVEERKKRSREANEVAGANAGMDALIETSGDLSVVPTLSRGRFHSLLAEKSHRYALTNAPDARLTDEQQMYVFVVENVINSFCSPENLTRATDAFINNSQLHRMPL